MSHQFAWKEVAIEAGCLHPPATPDRTSSKVDRGTVVVVAGGPACPGGALLSATAALRAGAGRVQIVTHASHATQVGIALPESMVHGCDSRRERWTVGDAAREAIAAADVVLVGPGLGGEGPELAREVLATADERARVVLDAAALRGVEPGPMRSGCVLLPNPTEVGIIVDDYPEVDSPNHVPAAAIDLSCMTRAVVAVRGAVTAVADPHARIVHVLDDPCPGLAIAGSGDVLAGVVTAACARIENPAAATTWAVAVHREVGHMLTERVGPTGFLASEIAATLPEAARRLAARAGTPDDLAIASEA
jgi:hydroxyethylthiazole kinase-like uncharacterized protein yjeF